MTSTTHPDTPTTSTAVATVDNSTSTDVEAYNPAEERRMAALMRTCATLAKSDLVPPALRDKPENIFALALYGERFGLEPMHAVQRIYLIQGTFEPKAEVLGGVIIRAGHELRWDEVSAERATVSIRRSGSDDWQATTWTIEQARKAGLLDVWVEKWVQPQGGGKRYPVTAVVGDDNGIFTAEERARRGLPVELEEWARKDLEAGKVKRKDPWHLYPDDMLAAKALRRGAKRIVPDAVLGLDDVADRVEDHLPEKVLARRDEGEKFKTPPPSDDTPPDPEDVIEDAEIVGEEPAPGPARPGAQQIAITLSRKGITDRDAKLRIVAEVLGLDALPASTKDLTPSQVGAVLRSLENLTAEDLAELAALPVDAEVVDDGLPAEPEFDVDPEDGEIPDADVVEDAPGAGTESPGPRQDPPAPATDTAAGDPSKWSDAAWRSFLSERGVKVTELLKEAQRLAREDGDTGPGTLADVAGLSSSILELLVGFVEDLAASRSGS